MTIANTRQRWGLLAQTLHWLMFVLMVAAWYAVETREEFPKGTPERAEWMALHKSLGLAVFFLVWVRLAARFSQLTPAGLGSALQQRLAALGHLALYLLMIAMPVSGVLASQFEDRAVKFFGLFQLPMLVTPNEEMVELLEEVHEAGFNILLALLAVHVAAALYHHAILKDDTLRRMLPWGK